MNMVANSHHRGHPIVWINGDWFYADGVPTSPERPCPRCGQPPTPEGHDACLGTIPGVSAACCGHGVTEPYQMETRP